jgi:hypothetical protein
MEQDAFLEFFYDKNTLDYLRNKFRDAKHEDGTPVYYSSKLSPEGMLRNMAVRVGDKVVKKAIGLNPETYFKGDITSVGNAASNRTLALFLQQYVPEKFEEFEKRHLPKAKVLKYNGKEKIFPVRIEDLQGNVLWPTKTGV